MPARSTATGGGAHAARFRPLRRAAKSAFAAFVFAALAGGCASSGNSAKTPPAPAPAAKPASAASAAKIAYVRAEWKRAEDFKRISEYLGGDENSGGDVVLRTVPSGADGARGGFYFTTGFAHGTRLPAGTVFTLEYLAGGERVPQTRRFTLPAEFRAGPFGEVLLGLTGGDWTDRRRKMVAWRLTVSTPDGRAPAVQKSFLWSLD
ncbi:MAG: hypothetical protein LBR07_07035 [Puniceicoccales bacterium]|nr:hypothetical protein [Puniceicoccales bacterium]